MNFFLKMAESVVAWIGPCRWRRDLLSGERIDRIVNTKRDAPHPHHPRSEPQLVYAYIYMMVISQLIYIHKHIFELYKKKKKLYIYIYIYIYM